MIIDQDLVYAATLLIIRKKRSPWFHHNSSIYHTWTYIFCSLIGSWVEFKWSICNFFRLHNKELFLRPAKLSKTASFMNIIIIIIITMNKMLRNLDWKLCEKKGTSMIVTSLVQSNCKNENFITNEATGCILRGRS